MTFRIDVKVNLLFFAISIILIFGAFFTYCIIFPLFERLLTFLWSRDLDNEGQGQLDIFREIYRLHLF